MVISSLKSKVFAFSLSFSQEHSVEFSRGHIGVILQKMDKKIHVPSLKSDIKEICKSVKQWCSSH